MHIIVKFSLASVFITTIAVVAGFFGLVDKKYVAIIVDANTTLQIIVLITFIFGLILSRKLSKGVKIIRYQFENKIVQGETDILPESLTSTNPIHMSIFTIYWEVKEFKEPPEFNISKKGNGKYISDIKKHILRVKSGIVEDMFVFNADIIVRPNEYLNCKFKRDTNVEKFLLGELYIP